jgi:hypothetical protein
VDGRRQSSRTRRAPPRTDITPVCPRLISESQDLICPNEFIVREQLYRPDLVTLRPDLVTLRLLPKLYERLDEKQHVSPFQLYREYSRPIAWPGGDVVPTKVGMTGLQQVEDTMGHLKPCRAQNHSTSLHAFLKKP